jgi:hypothetical protein
MKSFAAPSLADTAISSLQNLIRDPFQTERISKGISGIPAFLSSCSYPRGAGIFPGCSILIGDRSKVSMPELLLHSKTVENLGQAPLRPLIFKVFAVSARSQSHFFTASPCESLLIRLTYSSQSSADRQLAHSLSQQPVKKFRTVAWRWLPISVFRGVVSGKVRLFEVCST